MLPDLKKEKLLRWLSRGDFFKGGPSNYYALAWGLPVNTCLMTLTIFNVAVCQNHHKLQGFFLYRL